MAKPEQVSPQHETVMDVTVERLARVYAKAFMDAAAKSGKADEPVEELKSLVAQVLNQFPKLEQVFKSSLVSAEQKEALLDRVFGKALSVQVINFLKVLSRHGRLELVRPIVREVEKLHAERSGLADIQVRVAAKLDDSLLKEADPSGCGAPPAHNGGPLSDRFGSSGPFASRHRGSSGFQPSTARARSLAAPRCSVS